MPLRRVKDTVMPPITAHRMSFTKLVAMLVSFVLVAALGGVLAAGFVIPLAFGANTAADTAIRLFDELPAELQRGELSQASFVYDSTGRRMAAFWAENRVVVPLDRISIYMQQAVIAIEDHRFFEHGGVDPEGIFSALRDYLMGSAELRGASTLTMQFVKNILIDQALQEGDPFAVIDARQETLARKVREMKLAIAVEREMTKEEILEGYLNVAQFGVGIFGVEAAAQIYFGIPAADLNLIQAATIAGITQAPSTLDPTQNPELSQRRRNIVLNRMWQMGVIDTIEELQAALETPIEDTLNVHRTPIGCQAAAGAAFFCDYVIHEILTREEFGATQRERQELINRGGLRIYTTLVPSIQQAAEEALEQRVPWPNESDLNSAIVAVEPGTGHILAMAQNVPFDASAEPAPGYTAINFSAGPDHGGSRGFQSGSAFKPFVLAEWFVEGFGLMDVVDSNRQVRTSSDFFSSCGPVFVEQWNPGNVGGGGMGFNSVWHAMNMSFNTSFVEMSTYLDLCGIRNTTWDIGFRPTATDGGMPIGRANEDIENFFVTPAMVLGTQQTSPLSMATAYATFASSGTHCEPIAITRVTTAEGADMPVPSANCNPDALNPAVANTVTASLRGVLTSGVLTHLQLSGGRQSAGKTGTTEQASQTWFVGYTPQISTAVWVGNAHGNVPHFNIWVNGQFFSTLFASQLAAPIWTQFMNQAHADLPLINFPGPDPFMSGVTRLPPAPEPEPDPEPEYYYYHYYEEPHIEEPPAEDPPAEEHHHPVEDPPSEEQPADYVPYEQEHPPYEHGEG